MILDSQLSFVPLGGNLSLVAGAGIAIPSTNTLDLLGTGVGTAPTGVIFGTTTVFGEDPGIGVVRPLVEVLIGTAVTTSNAATLNVQFQAAIDTGLAGNYLPGTWNTLVETGAIAVANLTAASIIARFDFPPAFPAGLRPRYLRLNFVVPTATNFTAGTISAAIVTMTRDDQANRFSPKNFVVA